MSFYYFFLHRGFWGVFLLSTLDSSFLTLPVANDVAVIVLSSLHHERMWLYALSATLGSILGSYVMYWTGRKGGESFIEAHVSPQRFARMRERVSRRGPFVLAVPAIIPPPFPFTAWLLAAGALDVPRERFMGAIGVMRGVRFFAEGILALFVGRQVVAWLKMPSFRIFIDVLVVIAILASAYSILQLVRSTRRVPGPEQSSRAA